jgi:hypothetical protein
LVVLFKRTSKKTPHENLVLRAKMFSTALRTEYSAPINETKAAIRVILNGFLTAKNSFKITRIAALVSFNGNR